MAVQTKDKRVTLEQLKAFGDTKSNYDEDLPLLKISTTSNKIVVNPNNASGIAALQFRCAGTTDPQIITLRDNNGYAILNGTSTVAIADGKFTITAPGNYCFGFAQCFAKEWTISYA